MKKKYNNNELIVLKKRKKELLTIIRKDTPRHVWEAITEFAYVEIELLNVF